MSISFEQLEDRRVLSGDPSFLTTFGGIDRDTISDVAIAPEGDAYVTGTFANSVDFEPGPGHSGKTAMAGPDAFVARYSGVDGSLVWVRQFAALSTDSLGSSVEGSGIAVDGLGGVYVAGSFSNNVDFDGDGVADTSSARDVFVVRLDFADGSLTWLRQSSGGHSATELAVSPAGEVFVTGTYSGASFELGGHVLPGSPTDETIGGYAATTFVARLDANGTVNWLNGFAASNNGSSYSYDINLGPSGDIHVVGGFDGTVEFGEDADGTPVIAGATDGDYVIQLSADGVVNWVYLTDAEANSITFGDVALDPLGSILVSGVFSGPHDFDPGQVHPGDSDLLESPSSDAFVLQLDPAGNFLQVAAFGGEGLDRISDITAGPDGTIYVVGEFTRSATFGNVQLESERSRDRFFAALDANMNVLWVEQIVGEATAADIALDGEGNIFTAGSFSGPPLFPTADMPVSAGLTDAFLLKWNPSLPSIAGNVFADLNGDGMRNDDNRAIPAGWTVYLDANQNGQRDTGETVATSYGDTGNYTFGQVPAGNYTVAQENQSGWTQSAPLVTGQPASHTVSLLEGAIAPRLDFGNYVPTQKLSVSSSDVPQRIKRTDPVLSTLTIADIAPGSEAFIVDLDVQTSYEDKDAEAKLIYVDLVSPSGTTIPVFYSQRPLNIDAVFDDEAGAPPVWSLDPLTGRVKPSSFLSEFDGESSTGTWTLVTRRHWAGREAILYGWSIEVTLAVIPPGPPSLPPTADAGPAQSGLEDDLLTFNASGSTDPEGDSLTYHWDFGDGHTAQTTEPTVSHAYAWGGTFDVVLTVDDGHGNQATDTTTATVTEVNDVPVADAGGPYSGFENTVLTFDASASFDFDNHDGTTVNDQTLQYTWDFGDGTVVTTTDVLIDHMYTAAEMYTVTLTVSDGVATSEPATTTAVIDIAPAGDENDIYVWDIGFDSQQRGKKHTDYRIEIDIRRDSDADGLASSIDASAAGVYVTVALRDAGGSLIGTYTGATDSAGIFRTDWIRGLSPGNYTAEVIDLAHETYDWNHLLDNEPDLDGDSLPEDVLEV